MMCHSPFDDDITYSDSAKYGIQVPESSPEREIPGQWPPLSLAFHTSNWRSPIRHEREDRQPQLITKLWLAGDKHVDLPDGHMTLANITGQSYYEAFRKLTHVDRLRESSQYTPSLASDDSHSRDSPSVNTPRNSIKDLSLSPKLVSGVAQASFQSNEYTEAALALPFHSMEIDSTSESSQRDNISASILQSSASPDEFRKDVTKRVEPLAAHYASETSMPRSGSPLRLLCSFQKSQSAQSDTEQDDLMDSVKSAADGAYLPEPEPPRGSGIRNTRAEKLTQSSSLKKYGCSQCPRRFTRNFDMLRHKKNIHSTPTVERIIALTCTCCWEVFSRKDAFKRHIGRVPNSCIRYAKLRQKPAPAPLSEETYAIRKIEMMEVCTRQPS